MTNQTHVDTARQQLEQRIREMEELGGAWAECAIALRETLIVRLDRMQAEVWQLMCDRSTIDPTTGSAVVDAATREAVLALIARRCHECAQLLLEVQQSAGGAAARALQ